MNFATTPYIGAHAPSCLTAFDGDACPHRSPPEVDVQSALLPVRELIDAVDDRLGAVAVPPNAHDLLAPETGLAVWQHA